MGAAKFRRSAGPSATSETQDHSFQTNDSKPMRQLLKNTFTLALALVFTAGMAFGQSSTTNITQLTNNNNASVDQNGQGLTATVVQKVGNLNTATIRQNDDAGKTIESTIRQVGFKNNAVTNASRNAPNGPGAVTEQTQRGNHNDAFINADEGTSPSGDEGSQLVQFQDGNRNLARMSGGNDYNAEQRQVGSRNVARTSGNGKNADVFQKQVGNDNVARQEGSMSYAGSDQIQRGNDNRSYLNGIGHDGPGESYLTRQDGSDNFARLNANGYGGVLEIRQTGPQNTALVDWTSSMNETTITQSGFSNTAVVNSN
jgi:hypothetical protein